MSLPPSNPKALSELGEKIYREKYKESFERDQVGKFVAIDMTTQKAFIADTPEAAVELLLKEDPNSFFHLIKVGSPGVFKVGYSIHYACASYSSC
jgi:hypothetical protein